MNRKIGFGLGWCLGLAFLAGLLGGCSAQAPFKLTEDQDKGPVVLYYFWGNGCSHCEAAKPWLEDIDKRYPELSFTIADDQKPGIYQRIRKIMDASQSFWGLAGATVVMAAGVSLVEFSCTAGFPVLWTNLMAAQKVSALTFVLLLVVYRLIYRLDEMAIFFTAVFTLKASRLEEKQGRILKLAGGMLMLTLGVVMLFNPALLNRLSKSLIIFAIAFGLMVGVLVLHRRILPAFGIWIGTEAGGIKKAQRRSQPRSHRR